MDDLSLDEKKKKIAKRIKIFCSENFFAIKKNFGRKGRKLTISKKKKIK